MTTGYQTSIFLLLLRLYLIYKKNNLFVLDSSVRTIKNMKQYS